MARKPRQISETGWYHVCQRGSRQLTTYVDWIDHESSIAVLGESAHRFEVEIHSYCAMSNHQHGLVHDPHGNLSLFMHRYGTIYSQRFNRRYGLTGELFGDRFWSRPITNDADAAATMAYIERNPAAIVGLDGLEDYPWASLGALTGRRPVPEWLDVGAFRDQFAGDPAQLLRAVGAVDSSEFELPPWAYQVGCRDRLEELIATVVHVCRCPDSNLGSREDRRYSDARLLVCLLVSEEPMLSYHDLVERLGVGTNDGARASALRARRREQTDPSFAGMAVVARAFSNQHPLADHG